MSDKIIFIDESAKGDALPPPPPELGKNLQTIDDVRRWLGHPSNWHQSEFEHLRWGVDGPTISIRFGQRHQACSEEADGFYEFVLKEQHRIKNPVKDYGFCQYCAGPMGKNGCEGSCGERILVSD
ncbi:MAG: hypothetical protein ACYDHY_07000 [Acidiferrobacterales bacterium]